MLSTGRLNIQIFPLTSLMLIRRTWPNFFNLFPVKINCMNAKSLLGAGVCQRPAVPGYEHSWPVHPLPDRPRPETGIPGDTALHWGSPQTRAREPETGAKTAAINMDILIYDQHPFYRPLSIFIIPRINLKRILFCVCIMLVASSPVKESLLLCHTGASGAVHPASLCCLGDDRWHELFGRWTQSSWVSQDLYPPI